MSWLKSVFTAARVCTETPSNLADVLPCIQVSMFTGSADLYQFDTTSLDIDVYHATRTQARTLAYAVRTSVLHDLPGQYLLGAFVLSSSANGPIATPYVNTNLRRFTVPVTLRLHSR
jgi:hypothetical protein